MEILTKEEQLKKDLAQERNFGFFIGMMFYTLLLGIALLFSSCEKPKDYIYTFHWKESKTAQWNQFDFVVDEYLTQGGIEVYRKTKEAGVVQSGMTSTGYCYASYVDYCCSVDE